MAVHPQTTHNRWSKTYLALGGPDACDQLPRPVAVASADLVNPSNSAYLTDGEIVKVTSEAGSLRPVVSRVVAEDLDRGAGETTDLAPPAFAISTYGTSTAECQTGRVINIQRAVGHRFRYRIIDVDQLAGYVAGVPLAVALIDYDTATDTDDLIPKIGVSGVKAGLVPAARAADGATFKEYVAICDAVDDENGWIEAHWAPGILPPAAGELPAP